MKNRNHYVKRFAAWATALVLMLTGVICFAVAESTDEPFSQWNAEASALKALTEYVEDVTNEASPNYIPPVTVEHTVHIEYASRQRHPRFPIVITRSGVWMLSFLHSPTLTFIHDHWKNHSLD